MLSLLRARRGCVTIAVVGLALASAGCSRPARGPDVLLISLDTTRADELTFLDPEVAPNLAALARRGTVFEQAVSGSSWTLPAHAQLFTGMPPALHGVQVRDVRIDPLTPTLPELLRREGYATLGFWTGVFLAGEFGFARGFERYVDSTTMGAELEAARVQARAGGDAFEAEQLRKRREVLNHQDVTSERVVENVRAALDELDGSRPLFLFAHLFDPHYDFIPPAPYDRMFDPDYEGDIDGRDYYANRRVWDPEAEPKRRISERDLEHVRALYRGEIAWTDRAVGRILEELERRGRLADTLIVVTGDHGEEFFEHGTRGHKQNLFDEVLRVPLLIVSPGAAPAASARRVDVQVDLGDLAPTILDYAGIPAPASVVGRSLRPALEGAELDEVPSLSMLVWTPEAEGGGLETFVYDAVRTRGFKLVRVLQFQGERPVLKRVGWFDLRADPGEQHPLVDPADPRVQAGWKLLESRLARLRAHHASSPHTPLSGRTTAAIERFAPDLGALGYADTASVSTVPGGRWLLEPLPPMALAPAGPPR